MAGGNAEFFVMSVDWEEAVVSFSLPGMSAVEIADAKRGGGSMAKTVEQSRVGRLRLTGLRPEADYELEARWEGGVRRLAFRTLPAPTAPLRISWAAAADTHISAKSENRKGRLFMESASIVRDLVEEWNDLGVAGVFVAGDVTNHGTREEFAMARRALVGLQAPLLAAPGDHDVHEDAGFWQEAFGPLSWVRRMGGFVAVGLDTSHHALGEEGRRRIEEALAVDAEAVLLVSHLQLIPDDYIRFGKQKAIADGEASRPLLDELSRRGAIVYAGHQNALSRTASGRLVQMNLPQTCQFPCGWVWARVYGDRVYHTYRPIRSEVLNDYSRVESAASVERYNEEQWRQEYRLGTGPDRANFVSGLPGKGGGG